jgi:predicted  nucleic acid-binding Zn-ribbon protein
MIPPKVADRIEKIRAAVREERAAVVELDSQVIDLKEILRPASFQLDDVETFFLGAEALKETRSLAQWEYWLSNAERVLSHAVQQRQYVAGLVAKFGADARIMPSR